jgi:hypothetical protein
MNASTRTLLLRATMSFGASVLVGCLDEAPTFSPRGQRPPFVIAGQVDPPLGAVYEGPIPLDVYVPFHSEDVNIQLEARLYLDLVPGSGSVLTVQQPVPAGIYEDTRNVTMRWTTPVQGCHSLTFILTYFDNFVPSGPKDDSLAARVVWWLNSGDADGEVRMSTCPGSTQGAP